ncbi:hypothetical protein VTO42DRAFT_8474 [Malbranchea cinnamomea]
MARRYTTEELLRLRDSPLVVKPDSLPPVEEWMGPLADPASHKKHQNSRDQSHQTDSTNRRPSLFESRHISRTSNSDELVLGPPKTSFASATRGFHKSIDATDKHSRNIDDETRNDRFNFRDKFFRDKDFGERDRDSDRRDTRTSLANGRRIDREDWSGRPRRTFGQDDTDRRMKRGSDSDRWDRGEPREHRDQQEPGSERLNRDGREQGRYFARRDGPGRGRTDQNWFRDGDGHDTGDTAEDKIPLRHREWRRGLHGPDRDWNRPSKHDQEPEWLESSDRPHEARESHTQEDFQRWKERMKASSNQASEESKKEAPEETKAVEEKPADTKRVDGELFSRPDPSFKIDSGIDNFFELWSERKSVQDAGPDNNASSSVAKDTPAARPVKASRFAGIFNVPANDSKANESASAQPPRPASTDADQEGFQRILQLLGGKSRNTTPQSQTPTQPRPPPLQVSQADNSMVQSTMSPVRESPARPDIQLYSDNRGCDQNQGLENLVAQKASTEGATQKRDVEFLLRLMQQSKISQTPTEPQPPHLPSPGGHNMTAIHTRAQEPTDPREHLRRRATGGGYFDEIPYHGPSATNQTPTHPPGLQVRPQAGQPPIGLQRPPGLEQVVPSGWNQQLQQGGSTHPMAPPGLPNPHNRNMNPNFQSGPPMGMPIPTERPAFQRGLSNSGPGGFGLPPGIMPPPGYMNMNAPPPSVFPPLPHGSDSIVGMPHGNPNHFGPPQPAQHHQARQLLDMFTQAGGGHNDGSMASRNGMGMMGPGGYR